MPSNHLIRCRPLLLLPLIPPSIRVFSNESTLHMRRPKYWSFSFSISPSSEHPGLLSFRMAWLDLLAVLSLDPHKRDFATYQLCDFSTSETELRNVGSFFPLPATASHDWSKSQLLPACLFSPFFFKFALCFEYFSSKGAAALSLQLSLPLLYSALSLLLLLCSAACLFFFP